MYSDEKIYEVLDNYFKMLDLAPITPNGIFKSDCNKEYYETTFMYSFRKYRAAIYHYKNVKNFIKDDEDVAKKVLSHNIKEDKYSKTSVTKTADQYTYELSAFLAALKSSVDFLAKGCSEHFPGVTSNSINSFMKIIKKGEKRGTILDVIRKNYEWLDDLRSNRDNIIHSRNFTIESGFEKHVIDDISKIIVHPVCIPKSPPSNDSKPSSPYVPDTRESRSMESSKIFDHYYSETRVNTKNDEEKIIDYSYEYCPSEGYIAIEEFMESHLHSYETFFTELINALSEIDFKIQKS